jgi:hypothetical protein
MDMARKEECKHFWFVSVYGFFKENVADRTPGLTITKDNVQYPTFQHRIETVQADPQNAEGVRATEIMCALCGQRKDIEWPDDRTETVAGIGGLAIPRFAPPEPEQ